MRTLLAELRAWAEREADLHGPLVPVEEPGDEATQTAVAQADTDQAGADRTKATTSRPTQPADPADDVPGDMSSASSLSTSARSLESSGPDSSVSSNPEADGSSANNPNAAVSNADDPEADGLPAPRTATDSSPTGESARPSPTSSPAPSPSDSESSMPNYDLFGNEVDPTEDPSRPPKERIEALIPDDAPYKELETLDAVEAWVAENPLVPIDEDRENPVFGVGDPHADLLIIGEAPGQNEDMQGEPFVGRAGKLLDKILEAINFEREDVYIANILKSRPPRNRDPLAEEIEAHIPILYKQIALIEPAVILCVGKVAANTMLDRSSSLGSLREKEHDFYGIPLYATYHPAALLRNSQWKRPTWEDIKLVRTRYDELTGAS